MFVLVGGFSFPGSQDGFRVGVFGFLGCALQLSGAGRDSWGVSPAASTQLWFSISNSDIFLFLGGRCRAGGSSQRWVKCEHDQNPFLFPALLLPLLKCHKTIHYLKLRRARSAE